MYALGINQNICITSYSPTGYWRNDTILPTPLPFYPREGANICLEPSISYPSAIDIIWLPAAGATEYVLEWADNASFDGPSLRAVITANTNYALQKDVDIRIGQQIFWRVFARDGIGGLSLKSAPRVIKYECPENTLEKNPAETVDRCTNFDVTLKIHGDDYMKCCESKMWSVEFSYTGKDQLGNQLLSVQNIKWSLSASGSASKPEIIEETDDYVVVEACGATKEDSQIFSLEIRVTFVDLTNNTTFDCVEEKKVFLDCHAGVGNQPWAKGIQYDYLLSMPKESYSPFVYEPYVRGYFQHSYCYCDMLVVAGPVFKVPLPVPECPPNYIETQCCKCAPPWIPFQIETEFGLVGGTMVWNGEKWTFTDNRTSTANMCSSTQLTVELQCDGTEFSFSATEICGVPCTGTICSGRSFRNDTVTLNFESKNCDTLEPISSGEITLNRKELEGQWDSNNISACDDDCIYYAQLRLEQDPPKIYIRKFCLNDGDPIDEILNPDGEFDDIDCGPTQVTMTLELSDTGIPPASCCLKFTVTASLCNSGTTRTLVPQNAQDETFLFSNCTKPDGSIVVMWVDPEDEEALPVGGTLNLGGALPLDAGCLCQADYYSPIKVERYALEARVNIPLGCGLKSENGNLTLDPFPIAKLIRYLTGYLDISYISCTTAEPLINSCYGYCIWQWNYPSTYGVWNQVASYCGVSSVNATTTCDPQSCIEECLVRQYICGSFVPPPVDAFETGACCYWNGRFDEDGARQYSCYEMSEFDCVTLLEGEWQSGKCSSANCGGSFQSDPDCNCEPPNWCPPKLFNGRRHKTGCTSLEVSSPVDCNTTTTTTTADPSTTTPVPCFCPTTPEPCTVNGCCWVWMPPFGWTLAGVNPCTKIGCAGCPVPSEAGTPCDIAYTDCVDPVDPEPPNPFCNGICNFVSLPISNSNPNEEDCSLESFNWYWYNWTNPCITNVTGRVCNCPLPSDPPGPCMSASTNCGFVPTTADPCKKWIDDNCSTTPEPEGACCNNGVCTNFTPRSECLASGGTFMGIYTLCDHVVCPDPTTTTSTSTTADPSTTPEPSCDGECIWQWIDTYWDKYSDTCAAECPCVPPISPGIPNGIARTACVSGTTTTTTSTTSTTAAPSGACCYADISQNDPDCFPLTQPIIRCLEMSESECLGMYLGIWYSGQDCSPSPCYKCTTTTTTTPTTTSAPTGACCVGASCVSFATAETCEELGGEYQGDGTACSSVTCSECTGDCPYDWNGIGWVLLPEETCDCVCFPPATTPAPGPIVNPYPGTCRAL